MSPFPANVICNPGFLADIDGIIVSRRSRTLRLAAGFGFSDATNRFSIM